VRPGDPLGRLPRPSRMTVAVIELQLAGAHELAEGAEPVPDDLLLAGSTSSEFREALVHADRTDDGHAQVLTVEKVRSLVIAVAGGSTSKGSLPAAPSCSLTTAARSAEDQRPAMPSLFNENGWRADLECQQGPIRAAKCRRSTSRTTVKASLKPWATCQGSRSDRAARPWLGGLG
jgi:hypothetical protein